MLLLNITLEYQTEKLTNIPKYVPYENIEDNGVKDDENTKYKNKMQKKKKGYKWNFESEFKWLFKRITYYIVDFVQKYILLRNL